MVLAGLLAFTRGVIGILVPRVARTEAIATTPVALGFGAIALAYGFWLLRTVGIRWDRSRQTRGVVTEDPAEGDTPPRTGGDLADWLESPAVRQIHRYALACVAVTVVAGSFWTVNSFAAAYGRGRALDDAESLTFRPEVVLYTKESLRDLPDGVEQTTLPKVPTDLFRYRYRGLRLLVESNGRLFLVPAHWVAGTSRTLVIPYDNSVRIDLVAR
ncbi:hypothetical protein [Kribbella sp. CA-294648]|uniref:hypothetical protein n=1 Tax=Kribbella sp. CA-294648 TaxID=3239948 RepID=UPI003D8EED71